MYVRKKGKIEGKRKKQIAIMRIHLLLLVIGVVIFICGFVFEATARFRCDVIKPRAANCLAFIDDVAIVETFTLRGLCA